ASIERHPCYDRIVHLERLDKLNDIQLAELHRQHRIKHETELVAWGFTDWHMSRALLRALGIEFPNGPNSKLSDTLTVLLQERRHNVADDENIYQRRLTDHLLD